LSQDSKYLSEFDPVKSRGHERRFALSLEWVEPLLCPGEVVFDFGQSLEECPFDQAVRRLFPGVVLHTTGDADLRYRLTTACDSVHGVVAMEILEHMKDRQEDELAVYSQSGIRNLLAEALRILKPGGWLLLTTPNLSRYTCAWNLVRGERAEWCHAHVREFGYAELLRFVISAGFIIEKAATVDVWETLPCPEELVAVMDRLCPEIPRGDCTFMLARKPEDAQCD
jgi:SAM-dependent methyltransferase